MTLALLLHSLAAVIWVGGMFFAHMALRPAIFALDPPVRLTLMRSALGRFFPWVLASIAALLVSGSGMILSCTPPIGSVIWTTISRSSYPSRVTTSLRAPSGTSLSSKRPSAFVATPRASPPTETRAALIGTPVTESTTMPMTLTEGP